MLRRAMPDLERSYDITLEALGDALDLKDAETEGHSKRVTAYTIALARAMGVAGGNSGGRAGGVSARHREDGDSGCDSAQTGQADAHQQATMREHCGRGYQILRKIPFLRDAAEIMYTHQEHFDGNGYSRRLKGEEIPLGARIFSVADALDAIT